jgi:hypothetical protein
MKNKLFAALALTLLWAFNSQLSTAFAQGTAFTYQGRLNDGANPASGSYDLTFTLFSVNSGGSAVAGPVTNSAVTVSAGLFTTTIDLGNVFPGADRWLELAVRTNGGGAFTNLTPRQQITSTPYAVQALSAASAASYAGAISDSQLSGNIARLNGNNFFSGIVFFTNVNDSYAGTFSGNGTAVTNIFLANVSGLGTLTWPGIYSAASTNIIGNTPQAIVAGDFNGDGKMDVVTANNFNTSSVTVLTNTGGGGFALAFTINFSGLGLPSVAATDVNGDGKLDLVIGQASSPLLTIWTNAGNAVFVAAGTNNCGANVTAVAVGDFNSDGKPDLLVLTRGGPTATLVLLTNNGAGGFNTASFSSATDRSEWLAIADINGDNKPDVIGLTSGNPNGFLTTYTNDGSGNFTAVSTVSAGQGQRAVAAGDFNGDGRVDAVCVTANGSSVVIFTNNGTGAFTASQTNSTSTASGVAVLDLNNDGKLDFVVAGPTVTGFTNDGTGIFSAAFIESVGGFPNAVTAADFNGDGKLDLAFSDTLSSGYVDLLLQQPKFTVNSAVLPNISADMIIGGLTTNFQVLVPGGFTNVLSFTNGILRAIH